MDKLKEKYYFCDLLIVDDIEDLTNKDSAQEEFFHIIKFLMSRSKKIVITSHLKVGDLKKLLPRLMSYLFAGVHVELFQPNMSLIENVVDLFAHNVNVRLDEGLRKYIALNVGGDFRQAKGFINTLKVMSILGVETEKIFTEKVATEYFE